MSAARKVRREAALAAALVLAGGAAVGGAGEARAITRSEVLARAKAFALHPWTCTQQNLAASCNGAYQSVYVPGDYVGLPYDWGGYMTLFEFDQGILAGKGAGSYPDDGILACTVGLDCSGFVSKALGASHHTTSDMASIATAIGVGDLLAGDIFNQAGYHVAMYSHTMASGEPALYESLGYNVHANVTGGWSHVDGYTPRRYTQIEGTSAADVEGSPVTPILIGSFPFTDTRDTKESESDLLDGCAASPQKSESGPEYVYRTTFDQPGTLTAVVSDDVGVDIDIHLYTSMSTSDCVARNDTTLTVDVDCGTYYLVADTYKGAAEQPGLYTLTATFTPKNTPCGNGPPQYAPAGQPADACGNPNAPDLPFCNPNLGADTCLYTDQTSWCTMPCAKDGDCAALGPASCCGDIGGGEQYCFPPGLCASPEVPDQESPPEGGDPKPEDLTSSAGGSAGAGGTAAGAGGGASATGGAADDDAASDGGCSSTGAPVPGGSPALPALAIAATLTRRRRRRAARYSAGHSRG